MTVDIIALIINIILAGIGILAILLSIFVYLKVEQRAQKYAQDQIALAKLNLHQEIKHYVEIQAESSNGTLVIALKNPNRYPLSIYQLNLSISSMAFVKRSTSILPSQEYKSHLDFPICLYGNQKVVAYYIEDGVNILSMGDFWINVSVKDEFGVEVVVKAHSEGKMDVVYEEPVFNKF